MTTTTHVDLDLVLTVAGELRRLCQRAVKAGVSFSVFKQESWEAAPSPRPGRPRRTAAEHPERWPVLPPAGLLPAPGMALGAPGIPPSCPCLRRTGRRVGPVDIEEGRMKRDRDPAKPRTGRPCIDCGRPTPVRST